MTDKNLATRIHVEPEHYIPVAKHELVRALVDRIDNPDARTNFQNCCRMIDSIFHFEYHTLSNELKEDFSRFDAVKPGYQSRHSNTAERQQAEERFLMNFRKLMSKGNFEPLTEHDVDIAHAEDYLFNLPISVDWDGLDDQMLHRFFQTHGYHDDCVNPVPEEQNTTTHNTTTVNATAVNEVPDFANRILIYRRGVGLDRTTGRFVLEKIDILVSRCLLSVWKVLRAGGAAIGVRRFQQSPELAGKPESCPADDDLTGDISLTTRKPTEHIHEQRFIDRLTLRRSNLNLFSLARQTTIQEPTFKELVILFRCATRSDSKQHDHAIHIKMFRDIPMADLEVVFPEKKISMQPLDMVKLVITGAVGAAVVGFKLLFSVALNPLIALAMLTSIAGYAMKIALGFKASKDRYQHLVTTSLYDKNQDNDFGVIFYLVNALEEQEFKEAVLAYFFLLEYQPVSMSQSELDGYCEQFLKDHFDAEIDFEVDDAIEKLIRLNIVEKSGRQYTARPLREALHRLDERWDNYFTYNTPRESDSRAA